MKTHHQFLILHLALLLHFSAPASNADSLQRVIQSNASPKEKLQACIAWGDEFTFKNFDITLEHANRGIKIARGLGDSVSVGICSRHAGIAHYFKGAYDEAATYYYHSISLFEKNKRPDLLALAYNDLAKLYRKTRDLDRSLQQYDRAANLFRQLNDSAGMAMILNESGVVFEYKEDYDEALRRYSASLAINESLGDSVGISYALNFIAGLYTLQKKYTEAEEYILRVIDIRKNLQDRFSLALAYMDAGNLYAAKKQWPNAEKYFLQSSEIATAMGYRELLSAVYEALGNMEKNRGNAFAALDYIEKHRALKDSIFNIEKTRQIEELNARYETAKKEQIIQQQEFAITRRNWWIASISIALLLGSLLGVSYYRRKKLQQENRLQEAVFRQQELATRAVIEAEENERQRIARDLHDGVGQMMSAAKMNLSALESEIDIQHPEQKESLRKVITLVDDSCREVRSVSHNMMPNALLKNSLAAAIREFIDKLDHRALQVHLYTQGLDERLDANVETVFYRVIQECVHNVIRHSGADKLDISVIRDADGISATIEDNGKGFVWNEQNSGIGLRNIQSRISYLKGTVDVDSTPGKGTLVALHVPLI